MATLGAICSWYSLQTLLRARKIERALSLVAGRGDEAKHGGSGFDSRQPKHLGMTPRDMYEPDLHIDTLKIQARNFR